MVFASRAVYVAARIWMRTSLFFLGTFPPVSAHVGRLRCHGQRRDLGGIVMRLFAFVLVALSSATSANAASDWKAVDQVLGRSAAVLPGEVHRYSFPRTDLSVSL